MEFLLAGCTAMTVILALGWGLHLELSWIAVFPPTLNKTVLQNARTFIQFIQRT